MTRAFITALVAAMAMAPASGAAQTRPAAERLSLDTAIELALTHNRQVARARLDTADADERLALARIARRPAIETSAQVSQLLTPVSFAFPRGAFGDVPGIGPLPAADVEVTSPRRPSLFVSSQITQPLTPLFRLTLGVRAAATARERQRERERDEQRAVVTAVQRLLFEVQRTHSALRASDAAMTLLREVRRSVGVRVLQRVALAADGLEADLELAQEELTRTTRLNALASQQEQLNLLLGRDVRRRFEVDPLPPPSAVPVDVDAAVARALDSRPDVRQARLAVEQATFEQRAKAAERIPDVSLALSYSTYTNIEVLPRNLGSVGVLVRWEPFDWGRRRREGQLAGHAIARARLALREIEDRTAVEIAAGARTLAVARAALAVASLARGAAQEQLRTVANRFENEAALLADVLRTRAALASRDDRYEQALLACWTARIDLNHAIGEDLIP